MKCVARTREGFECGAEALQDDPDGMCWAHTSDSTISGKRAEARSLGGRNAHRSGGIPGLSLDVRSPDGILTAFGDVATALAEGRADRAVANSLGYLLRNALEAHKVKNHEIRIARLERALNLKPEIAEPTEAKA